MKYILMLLTVCFLIQTDADAQSRKKNNYRKSHARRHHTYYRTHNTSMKSDDVRPSPYKGDNTPSNDGPKKNQTRNLNSNSGQPLPPNNGGR